MRDGILKHSKGKGQIFSDNPNLTAMTLEGQIVRIADIAAYVNHDLDDAIRAGLLTSGSCPTRWCATLGKSHSQRIETMIRDLVESSRFEEKRMIRMSDPVLHALYALRDFLYERVYESKGFARSSKKRSGSSRSCGVTFTSTRASSASVTAEGHARGGGARSRDRRLSVRDDRSLCDAAVSGAQAAEALDGLLSHY